MNRNPFGYILDTLVTIVINLFIPVPLARTFVREFRGPVLGCLMSAIVLGIFMMVVIGTVLMSPFLVSTSLVQKITTFFGGSEKSIEIDAGFTQTSVPRQIPLGGDGLSFASITAGFMDPGYFLIFGMNHTGIDLVPNTNYYENNTSYKEYNKVIVYATHSGKASVYTDQYGAETVEVLAGDGKMKSVYKHMKQTFVSNSVSVRAGTPVGEMGKTGLATAEHVHYEIRLKSGDSWVAVNPLTYIK